MKREQIIEILKNNIRNIVIEDQLSGGDPPYLTHKYHTEWVGFDEVADAILALPLDVPSDGQRIAEQSEYLTDAEERAFYSGQKWMR